MKKKEEQNLRKSRQNRDVGPHLPKNHIFVLLRFLQEKTAFFANFKVIILKFGALEVNLPSFHFAAGRISKQILTFIKTRVSFSELVIYQGGHLLS